MSAPIGAEYSANQLQRASDAVERGEQVQERLRRWQSVVDGLLSGSLAVGTRRPVGKYPEWVTLEVVTGGFATGASQAAGPLLPHEAALLNELGLRDATFPRLALNRYFLSSPGVERLLHAIESRRFVIDHAEEAALPTIAWLIARGHDDIALKLVETLAPFAHELRFYPRLDASDPASEGLVHLESIGMVLQRLKSISPNQQVLMQREAVGTWTPLYDSAIGLILETIDGSTPIAAKDGQGSWLRDGLGKFVVTGGWPFKCQPSDWAMRTTELLDKIRHARSQPSLSNRFSRAGEPFSVLVEALTLAVNAPQQLTGRDVGRVRLIVARYVSKRGVPDSSVARADRTRHRLHATARTHQEIAQDVALRLATYPPLAGLEDTDTVLRTPEKPGVTQSASETVPPGVLRRLQRCVRDSPEGLIRRGVVPSAEVLAKLLPQRSGELRAAGFNDPLLHAVYAANYRAFRRRRSLLLLNLQKQVQLEELPWVAAMDLFRDSDEAAVSSAAAALEEFASIAIARFPQTMLPNKLLQEFVGLAQQANKSLPFTMELAADIFMGQFSPRFVEAAMIAATHLQGTLYAQYFRVDYRDIANRLSAAGTESAAASAFAAICAERAGEVLGTWRPAGNGRIIEQQLIITSHNLAALFELQGVRHRLADRVQELAGSCYEWALRHLQRPMPGDWRVELHRIKNAAYAWRQMVFLLSLRSSETPAFLTKAEELLSRQPDAFIRRFSPALQGLRMAVEEPESWLASEEPTPFLGWKDCQRWRVQAG